MLMTSGKLILLRLFNLSLGRSAFFSRLLRKVLIRLLIKGKKGRYTQCSRYFDIRELEN